MPAAPTTLRHFTPRRLAAVAVLCLSAQAAGVWHLLVVQHGRCVEHGEVIHVDDHRGEVRARAHDVAGGDLDMLVAGAATGEAEHEEHCDVVTERRAVPWTSAVSAPIDQATIPAGLISRRVAPALIRALYRLAPKISPPSVA